VKLTWSHLQVIDKLSKKGITSKGIYTPGEMELGW
jgi:hypothetical protein